MAKLHPEVVNVCRSNRETQEINGEAQTLAYFEVTEVEEVSKNVQYYLPLTN
jgi:hypothetical protein